MPHARQGSSSVEINGKIYVIGGFVTQPFAKDTNEVWAYDPNDETWTQKTNMPTIRNGMSVSVLEGKIYVMGGFNFNIGLTALSTFDVYDPLNDKWDITQNMPDAVGSHCAAIINKRIYRVGGMGVATKADTITHIVYEYNPFTQPSTSVSPASKLLEQWGSIKSVR